MPTLTLTLILTASLAGYSLAAAAAAAPEALVGWQLDGNSRSTWDILWSCFSTIIACTWTVLHLNVPGRDVSKLGSEMAKVRHCFFAILVPEVYFWAAAMERLGAGVLREVCDAAQATQGSSSADETLDVPTLAKQAEEQQPTGAAQGPAPAPVPGWTLRQCFCIRAGGLALQTRDEWIYRIRAVDMRPLVRAGVVRSSDFGDADVQDRAEADSFAKACAIGQGAWFVCSAVARRAYALPVTPLELATVAYVVCAVLMYGMWRCKPKNMSMSVVLRLRCDRDNLPIQVRGLLESNPAGWAPPRERRREKPAARVLWETLCSPLPFAPSKQPGPVDDAESDHYLRPTPGDLVVWGAMCNSASLAYCAIHLTAWNFLFATDAERTAWRIFSLTSLTTTVVFCAVTNAGDYIRYLESKNMMPSFAAAVLARSKATLSLLAGCTQALTMAAYVMARLGMTGLVFASLRALPAGSYTTIDWVTAIPHF